MQVNILKIFVLALVVTEINCQPPVVTTTYSTTYGPLPPIITTNEYESTTTADQTRTSSFNPGTTPTTPESTIPTNPPMSGPCYGRNGEFILEENICSRFMVCSQNEPVYLYCPQNYIFDADQKRCIVGDPETCIATPVNQLCLNTFFGAFPHPTNPNQFVSCMFNKSGTMPCGEGLVFQSMVGKCV